MVRACAEEGSGVYREKNAEDGSDRQEEKKKSNLSKHTIQILFIYF